MTALSWYLIKLPYYLENNMGQKGHSGGIMVIILMSVCYPMAFVTLYDHRLKCITQTCQGTLIWRVRPAFWSPNPHPLAKNLYWYYRSDPHFRISYSDPYTLHQMGGAKEK